jgi:hypothetical protein
LQNYDAHWCLTYFECFLNEHSITIQDLVNFEPHILHNWYYFDSFSNPPTKILYDLVFEDYWDISMSTKLWSKCKFSSPKHYHVIHTCLWTSNELQANEDNGRCGRCKQQTQVIDSIFKHNNLLLEHVIASYLRFSHGFSLTLLTQFVLQLSISFHRSKCHNFLVAKHGIFVSKLLKESINCDCTNVLNEVCVVNSPKRKHIIIWY